MKEKAKEALYKLKTGWKRHEREIILFVGVFLVGIIGFEIGLVEGQAMQSKPLVIEAPAKPAVSQLSASEKSVQGASTEKTDTSSATKDSGSADIGRCAFVGSKNSDKYHLPTCAVVKRIKDANKVCFTSEEDAKSKGYQPGCLK